jgi:hypothetical protein
MIGPKSGGHDATYHGAIVEIFIFLAHISADPAYRFIAQSKKML